jgi:hypothetical protein
MFTSARGNDPVIAVISQRLDFMVDDDDYTVGTMLAPNRIEFLLHAADAGRACRILPR